LQRYICDFSAETAFGHVQEKIMEHHGVKIANGAAYRFTIDHAKKISEKKLSSFLNSDLPAPKEPIIAQSDGSMIPILEHEETPDDTTEDRRKAKRILKWKEARLSLACTKDLENIYFAATTGSPEEAGKQLKICVQGVGGNDHSRIHGVGDGAPWIANQFEEQFGSNGNYLIDFMHLSGYLSAASEAHPTEKKAQWLEEQKAAMKENQSEQVLARLKPYIEALDKENRPVADCYRYIKNRPKQFNYQEAIKEKLPIGSGQIESAHRYIVQKRLKVPGAWWKPENAQHMLNLRVLRANKNWSNYWQQVE